MRILKDPVRFLTREEQAKEEREEFKKMQLLAFLKSGESSGEGPSRKVSRKLQDKKVPASNKARVGMAASGHGQWSLC